MDFVYTISVYEREIACYRAPFQRELKYPHIRHFRKAFHSLMKGLRRSQCSMKASVKFYLLKSSLSAKGGPNEEVSNWYHSADFHGHVYL